jgi:N-acetylglutamate synthase-like GNAT family acetyltransferase
MKFRFINMEDPAYPKELMLRWEVLRKPLGLPPGSEALPEEKDSMHLIALVGKQVVGCVLFYPESGTGGRVHQLAVSEEYRGQGFGRQLIMKLEQTLIKKGFLDVYMYALLESVGFYQQLGYHSDGSLIEKNGVSHQFMKKNLLPSKESVA